MKINKHEYKTNKHRSIEQRTLYAEWIMTIQTQRQLLPLLHSNHNDFNPTFFDPLEIKEAKL